MIKPNDIILTRRDRFKILCMCLNDMIPWQIPASMLFLGVLTNTLMINNADWYSHLSGWELIIRIAFCALFSFLELAALIAILAPIEEKVSGRWDRFEKKYRERAVREVDEFLLSKRNSEQEDSDEA